MTDLGNDGLLRELCAAAEFVGAETNYSRDLLASRCPKAARKIFRVYNGIDLSRFPETTDNRTNQALPGPVRLLSVGRLVAFKGFHVLIDACTELKKRGIDFALQIIGDGALRKELETRVRQQGLSGRIQFAGEQSQNQVLTALRACDIFVLASTIDEGGASDVFPTVIAEAMASGRSVVSTAVAGIPELVANGETGLLVPPDDSHGLANALERLSRDGNLRANFGRAARRRIENVFTIERTIEPLLEHFAATARSVLIRR